MLITQHTHGCGVEQQVLGLGDGQPNPSCGKDATKVTMGEERDISSELAELGDEGIRTVGNLRRRFPIRRAVEKQIPARPRLENLRGCAAFVRAIVPFGEFRFEFGSWPERCQRARLSSALQGTGQDMGKWDAAQAFAHGLSFRLATRGEWEIHAPAVLARE